MYWGRRADDWDETSCRRGISVNTILKQALLPPRRPNGVLRPAPALDPPCLFSEEGLAPLRGLDGLDFTDGGEWGVQAAASGSPQRQKRPDIPISLSHLHHWRGEERADGDGKEERGGLHDGGL
jgi:hypothetical protein